MNTHGDDVILPLKIFWGRQIYIQEKSIFPSFPDYNCVLSNARTSGPKFLHVLIFGIFAVNKCGKIFTPLTKLSTIQPHMLNIIHVRHLKRLLEENDKITHGTPQV